MLDKYRKQEYNKYRNQERETKMNWIVRNEPKQEKQESFEERMAELQNKVQGASDEQLEAWMRPELHDLCQAARIELQKRQNAAKQNHVGADPIWTR